MNNRARNMKLYDNVNSKLPWPTCSMECGITKVEGNAVATPIQRRSSGLFYPTTVLIPLQECPPEHFCFCKVGATTENECEQDVANLNHLWGGTFGGLCSDERSCRGTLY